MEKVMRNATLLIMFAGMLVAASECPAGTYVPWDELTEASWIDFGDVTLWPNVYPINAGRPGVAESYALAFSPAGGNNKAKGMNAIKFRHGSRTTGHMVSADQAGTFDIVNTGQNNVFTDLLLLVAINAGPESLADDFELTLHPNTAEPFVMGPNHFAFYDNPFGRPSGYYYTNDPADPHSTDPAGEPIAYAFDKAMVTVFALEDLSPMQLNHFVSIGYSFKNLPGPAVFSAYGYIGTDPLASIYHTNRTFVDSNDGKSNPVSTFAVTVPGDVNKDLRVDIDDISTLLEYWLIGTD
jgi:hypothetical protein